MSQGKNKLTFLPSLMVKATLCIVALQYFLQRGTAPSDMLPLVSLVEPYQNPCLGSIFILHSDVRPYLLLEEGKKMNFQRQNCSLSFIPPPTGVDIKLFQVCRKQGTECLVGLELWREGVTAALLIWKQGKCRYHQHLCPLLTHRH